MKVNNVFYLQRIVAVLCILLLIGCTSTGVSKQDYLPVQGDDQYGIQFEPDWDVFEKGTYTYAPKDNLAGLPLRIGGGRAGYLRYYPLVMKFSFKDGRKFHEEFDIETLMRELMQRENILDTRKTKWGGSVNLEVNINAKNVIINYLIFERYENKKGERYRPSKRHRYHVLTRKLQPIN